MNVDNICKYLAETYPDSLAAWLLGTSKDLVGPVDVIKTELTLEPIRADFAAYIQATESILHVEFQLKVPSPDATPLNLRMLDYWVRFYRRYRVPVYQVLVLIKPTTMLIPDQLDVGLTRHAYRVVKLWTEDPAPFLADEALLPLAVLAQAADRQELLSAVAEKVRRIESPARRSEISAIAQVLAGVVSSWEVIRAMFGEDILKESVVYQEIMKEGRAEGRAEGEAEGMHEGARLVLQGVLELRFGSVPPDVLATLDRCPLPVLQQLVEVALSCLSVDAFDHAARALAPPM